AWDEEIDFERHVIAEKQNMIITNERRHYLREIATHVRDYHKNVSKQSDIARKLYQLEGTKDILNEEQHDDIDNALDTDKETVSPLAEKLLNSLEESKERYAGEKMSSTVRDKEFEMDIVPESLSGIKVPKVSFPKYVDWGERLTWLL